jgi:cytoskeleton protein RodZ
VNEQHQLIPICIGEQLRQKRESRGIDPGEVSERLKIDEQVIRAIEADEFEYLAPLYRRGYIKSYAMFLGFDREEVGQMLDSIENELPALRTVFPETGKPGHTDRWLKVSSYVLASLLIGTLAWQFTHEAVRLSQDGSERSGGMGDNGSPGLVSALGTQPGDPASPSHVNASIAALEAIRQQRKARSSAGPEAWAALQNAESQATGTEPLADGEYILELSASADSWVEITDASGRQLELDLVRGGTTKQYRGEAPFSIQLGRASAISLYLDGQPVDIEPFTEGDVTQMQLDGSTPSRSVSDQDPDAS